MAQFGYTAIQSVSGSMMPVLSLELSVGSRAVQISGIVDTGSAVNILPFRLGLALGAVWEEQQWLGNLTGGLSGTESRGLSVKARNLEIEGALDVPLLFAWAKSDEVPTLFGQTNFLMEFNVCFYRSQGYFEVWRN